MYLQIFWSNNHFQKQNRRYRFPKGNETKIFQNILQFKVTSQVPNKKCSKSIRKQVLRTKFADIVNLKELNLCTPYYTKVVLF